MSLTAAMITRAFEMVASSRDGICAAAAGHSVTSWRALQLSKAGVLGATAAAIPVAGYATMPLELLVLMRWMHRSALGVGCIKVGAIAEGDFRNIMALWAGQAEITDELGRYVTTRMVADRAAAAGATSAAPLFTRAFALGAEALGGAPLGGRLAEVIAARLGPNLASKTATRWMPLVSAAVGGAANMFLIQRVMTVADRYYDFADQQERAAREMPPPAPGPAARAAPADTIPGAGVTPKRKARSATRRRLASDQGKLPGQTGGG